MIIWVEPNIMRSRKLEKMRKLDRMCFCVWCLERHFLGNQLGTAYLNERVDGHDGHIGLRFGVVHQIQIDQLLELQVVRLHAVDDVRKECGNVLANRHAGNDLERGRKIMDGTNRNAQTYNLLRFSLDWFGNTDVIIFFTSFALCLYREVT